MEGNVCVYVSKQQARLFKLVLEPLILLNWKASLNDNSDLLEIPDLLSNSLNMCCKSCQHRRYVETQTDDPLAQTSNNAFIHTTTGKMRGQKGITLATLSTEITKPQEEKVMPSVYVVLFHPN